MSDVSSPIRLVVADDHPFFLEGLVMLFQRLDWADLCGSASDGDELLALIAAEQPSIVLIDLSMSGASVEQIISTVEADHPQTRLIALTMLNDAYKASQLLTLGLSGYVVKGMPLRIYWVQLKRSPTADNLFPLA